MALLLERGLAQGYLPDMAKSLFICAPQTHEGAAWRAFKGDGLKINFLAGIFYLRVFVGPQKDTKAWVMSKVDQWADGVQSIAKVYA